MAEPIPNNGELAEHLKSNAKMLNSLRHYINDRYARSVYRRSRDGDRHRPVVIERGCWIGAHVTNYPGVIVREGCVINAGTVLTHNTKPNDLYGPPPAQHIKYLVSGG